MAAEEHGKYRLCFEYRSEQLDDPQVQKKFWDLFTQHSKKFERWEKFYSDLVIVSGESGEDVYALSGLSGLDYEPIENAAELREGALYVDVSNGQCITPNTTVGEDVARNALEAIASVIEMTKFLVDSLDHGALFEADTEAEGDKL